MQKTLLLFLGLLIFATAPVFAQSAAKPAEVSKTPADSVAAVAATELLAAKYQLTAAQKTRMQAVQLRKFRSLAELEVYKTTDPDLYRQKVKSLQSGTLASIRHLLTTREQLAVYRKTQSDLRKERSARQQELVAQQASKEALEEAMLLLYAE